MQTDTDAFVGPPHRVVRGLSWGALLFTPLWLFRNGFWLSAVLYVLCAIFVWPAALVIAALFFIFGTQWSWSKGQRWRSYRDFCDSRFNWEFMALLAMLATVVIVLLGMLAE